MERAKEKYHRLQKSTGHINMMSRDGGGQDSLKPLAVTSGKSRRTNSDLDLSAAEGGTHSRGHSRGASMTKGLRGMLRSSIGNADHQKLITEYYGDSATLQKKQPSLSLSQPSQTQYSRSGLYLNGIKTDDMNLFYESFANDGDFSSSDESDDSDVTKDASIGSASGRIKKTLTGEDYAVYVLAMRCFLVPFIDANASQPRKTKWRTLVRASESSNGIYSKKITSSDLDKIISGCKTEMVKQRKKADVDKVYVEALTNFTQKAKEDKAVLLAKGFNTAGDFIRMFTEIARLCMRKIERRVDEDSLAGLKTSFEKIVADYVVNTSDNRISSKGRQNSNENVTRKTSMAKNANQNVKILFTDRHTALAKVYNVPKREHMEILGREERLNTPEIILEELKLRKFGLESHPTSNKDTFVHKTASYLKWLQTEDAKINALMKQISEGNSKMMKDYSMSVQSVSGAHTGALSPSQSKQTMTERTRSGLSIKSASSSGVSLNNETQGPGGDFIVGIIKARNLTHKGGSKDAKDYIPSPYCVVEFGKQTKRTTTAVKNASPLWREQCTFTVAPAEDHCTYTFKIGMMDETDNSGRLVKRSDTKLGKAHVTLQLSDLDHTIEKYYKLEHRKDGVLSRDDKKDEACGDVLLRIEYRTNDRKLAEEQAKEWAEQEKREEKRLKEIAKNQNQPDYNKLYESLFMKVFDFELERCSRAHKKFCIRNIYWRLLDEFRVRYGVGDLFAAVLLMSRCIAGLDEGSVSIESYWYLIHHASKMTEKNVRWTNAEMDIFEESVTRLESILINKLSHYKDYFPFSTPKGHLTMYLRCLEDLYNSTLFREKNTHAKDVTVVIQMCVETCCKTLYSRYEAMAAPATPYPTQAELFVQVDSLVGWIIAEMTNDAVYFATDFTGMDGERLLDIVQVSVTTFGQLLWTDIDCVMLEHFQGSFNEKVISLYFKLKEFNSWCTENSGDFKGFDLTNTWAPYITSWLAEVRANSTANVELLLEQETWQPTSSLELHSVSSTRLLSRYFELYSFLDKLEWEDREQYAHFVRVFAESVAVTLREYCVQSSRLLRSLHEKRSGLLDSLQRTRGHSASMVAGETPRSPIPNTQSLLMDSPGMESDDQGDFYRVSQKACVLLNNIEMVRQKMQQLCSAMHIDQAFTQAAEQAMANSVLSAQRIASMPYMDNEDSNISGAVAEGVSLEMQNTASIVFNSLASMSNALAIKLCAPLYEILVSIAAMPSGFNKFIHGISFFDKKSNGPRDARGRLSLEETQEEKLSQFERVLSQNMQTMSEMQYLNVYVRCLNAVWGEILRIVERIVIDEKYDVRRIRALENALESLWACVHAKGNGLPADVLAEERYKILRQVLTAMEANDGESVVNLHMFNQENPKQAAFLKEVMKKSKDKYIQMYLSSIP